jgi:hypothetical protein
MNNIRGRKGYRAVPTVCRHLPYKEVPHYLEKEMKEKRIIYDRLMLSISHERIRNEIRARQFRLSIM